MTAKNINEYVPYEYRHAPVPGGGFVTGFCFHPKASGILYARTDIGGTYRYEGKTKSWISLMDHVKATGKWETYSLSIALDVEHPSWLYVAAGDWKKNYLCRSKDYGNSFEYFPLPVKIHGNAPGRGTGERLMVDPCNSSILYFGSQDGGLLISEDYGEQWNCLFVKPKDGKAETNIAFIWIDPRSYRDDRCQTIVVSTSGKENSPEDKVRGKSLYLSVDAGKTFTILPGQPDLRDYGNYPGFVGQRAACDGNYLYITMAALQNATWDWNSYACDSGGNEQGVILRYELTEQGEIKDYKMITPDMSFIKPMEGNICEFAGFGGIDVNVILQGHLICSTQCCQYGDAVLYSTDYGEHWQPILYRLSIGQIDFQDVPYMKPEYNNNDSLIHWLSDIKIDPFCSDRAVFNTGTGIFMTENLLNTTVQAPVLWKPSCKGLEETVHLNVYSPPSGDVKLIDIIGDLGAFAFTDLNHPAENSFADENKHRYITCLNADYPDTVPNLVAVTARGNWTGETIGGLIWSEDQCKTWKRLSDPLGITKRIDKLIEAIRRPNTNSGWTAISADAKTLVWCVGEKYQLPLEAVVYTEDLGNTWVKCKIFDCNNKMMEEDNHTFKVFSDRVDPEVFYGFGDACAMYISTDRARSFHQILVAEGFPKLDLGVMDSRVPAEIRAELGKTGIVWIATGEGGLWKIAFQKNCKSAIFERISKNDDFIYRQGMGMAAVNNPYQTLYVNGIINGAYGFFRSLDEGKTWQRISKDNQMYGDILSITGDPRNFGRFYIATGSRGVLWGEPSNK